MQPDKDDVGDYVPYTTYPASLTFTGISACDPWGVEFSQNPDTGAGYGEMNSNQTHAFLYLGGDGGSDLQSYALWGLQATVMPELTNTKYINISCREIAQRRTTQNSVGGLDDMPVDTLATIPISYTDFGIPQTVELDLAPFVRINTYEEAPSVLSILVTDQAGS